MQGNKNIHPKKYEFSSVRSDWYLANSALPKAFRRHMSGKQNLEFIGFPRQWIPIFEWYGIPWSNSIAPQKYIPIFSDFNEKEVVEIVLNAKKNGALRNFIEASSMYDAITSDFLYIMDHTATLNSNEMERDLSELLLDKGETRTKKLLINGWQAFGRPSIIDLENKILSLQTQYSSALILPCSLSRPYWKSRTHTKIYKQIQGLGYDINNFHKIVITSIGVLPEELWELPQVLAYDAGVPDIYRILRLARGYFSRNNYELILDCLQFEPYSDVLRIVASEGFIKKIVKVKTHSSKQFSLSHY